MMLSCIRIGGAYSERYGISGRAVGEFSLLSVGPKSVFFFPLARLLCLHCLGFLGQYLAPILSSLCTSQSSLVHERQLIAECLLSISLGIGRVTVSPHEFPMEIRLSLLVTLGLLCGGVLRFWDLVTAFVLISFMR